jgi:transposase
VLALVSALEPVVARISELTIEIRHALQAHPDGATFRSLFIAKDSWLCAATMLAEIGDCRERYPTYRALAADAGQCPVAVESGKSKRAQFRWACDHRLRQALCTLSDASRRHNPWAADIYDRARARGAPATPTPPASSAARGVRSSGASGTSTTPTTPRTTPHYRD